MDVGIGCSLGCRYMGHFWVSHVNMGHGRFALVIIMICAYHLTLLINSLGNVNLQSLAEAKGSKATYTKINPCDCHNRIPCVRIGI